MMKRNSAQNNIPSKKGGIAEEIEKLKQRREDRKNKGGNGNNEENSKNQNGKSCDADYENMIRKKKIQFNQEPENVNFENKKNYLILFSI